MSPKPASSTSDRAPAAKAAPRTGVDPALGSLLAPDGVARLLEPGDTFPRRHIGLEPADVEKMLAVVQAPTLDALMDETVPAGIRMRRPLDLGDHARRGETETVAQLKKIAQKNRIVRSFIGQGYTDCITPGPILRNILENPGWYTQYTPYQAEIAQGRLEALLNFQTLVSDMTGMPLANASLLDEATAAAEAMRMAASLKNLDRGGTFFVADDVHPQTRAVVETRAAALGVRVVGGDIATADLARAGQDLFGVLVQYPSTDGVIRDLGPIVDRIHAAGAKAIVATDLLALTLLKPPGESGADIAIGSAQRFGVPMGCGGPHAAFMAAREEHGRKMPGRIVGLSKDKAGKPAIRLALGTREQHIRREKATSNICTAQVLLAVMASMYAAYHGPRGLEAIARRVKGLTDALAEGLRRLGHATGTAPTFDTLRVRLDGGTSAAIQRAAADRGMNLRVHGDGLGVTLDETTTAKDVEDILACFALGRALPASVAALAGEATGGFQGGLARTTPFLTHPTFNRYHSETELLRYMHRLESRDLSLNTSMIALGSCTMKLNATAEMIPVTWPEFGRIHPFAPADQLQGYAEMCAQLEGWLEEITGFAAVSLQPNAGSQGEYAGLLTIRAFQAARGQAHRDVCLIPMSAHGTNPATATMAGLKVVAVLCDAQGNIDVADLRAKAKQHEAALCCLMVTYPSTHGVFEEPIKEICDVVHQAGGQVYMDGANMNAQVGLCRPGDFGADVCHLNLHKTFCIPHGGGGPGMGPIGVAAHLAPFLPGHPSVPAPSSKTTGPVSAAPWGSASILTIPWVYIALMGSAGLTLATKTAILAANYMAKRLAAHYPILYTNARGRCAHEFIVDLRPFKTSADVSAEDVAKRLMDYGFHAPTVSFPVPGTMMIEPTESESLAELDRFCDAMIGIRDEIRAIEAGKLDKADNPLKNAPHTMDEVVSSTWKHPYPREQAAFPAPWTRDLKFWPAVGRIDGVAGDRHLICTCPPMEA